MNENVNVNESAMTLASVNAKREEIRIGYLGTFLGAEWIQGVKKGTNESYAFGKVKIDFDGIKRDGSLFTKTCEFMVNDPRDLPSNEIERYSKVYVEFKAPSTPQGKLEFVRIVRNV